jgi:RNA polymerase sigma-70 factor (ECF subfamily)
MGRKNALAAAVDPVSQDLTQLFLDNRNIVYNVCLRLVRDPTLAEDLAQQVWVAVLSKISGFRGDAQFSTWLYRITVNVVYMHFRKKGTSCEISTDPVDFNIFPDRPFRPDLRSDILSVVRQLPRGYRMVFLLHDMYGYEHEEIGKLLGISSGTSKSQLHKARLRARDLVTKAKS